MVKLRLPDRATQPIHIRLRLLVVEILYGDLIGTHAWFGVLIGVLCLESGIPETAGTFGWMSTFGGGHCASEVGTPGGSTLSLPSNVFHNNGSLADDRRTAGGATFRAPSPGPALPL